MKLMQRFAGTLSRAVFALLGLGLLAVPAHAAEIYPSHPVRWIVPYTPAGTTDILARVVGAALSEELGQQFIIENRPGAGNNLGTEAAIRSDPDGYTILLVNPAHGINATLYKKLNFNVLRDVMPVAGITRVPNVMEVNPNFPAKTVAEFIAYGKANPGKINFASSGNGTSVHMSGEMFMAMTGIKMTHVPYKGAGPALIDLIGGTVDVLFDNLPSSIEHIRGGKLRAVAVTTDNPSPFLPGVPTVGATVKGYEASAWFGIGVPKGTPQDRIDILNKAVNKVLATDKMKAKLADLGGEPMIVSPKQFGDIMKSETEKWEKVVKFSGASID
jgi:tripartite-type tricarboxylate transporter receptor subunit TctC